MVAEAELGAPSRTGSVPIAASGVNVALTEPRRGPTFPLQEPTGGGSEQCRTSEGEPTGWRRP